MVPKQQQWEEVSEAGEPPGTDILSLGLDTAVVVGASVGLVGVLDLSVTDLVGVLVGLGILDLSASVLGTSV